MITEILILLLLIGVNGLFAMGEMAILSARKSRLTHMTENGDKGARLALFLSANPTRFLSTIQTGITFVNVLTGMYGGLALAVRMTEWLSEIPLVAKFAESLGLAFAVAIVSFVSLIFGELVPKRIAIGNPEALSSALARFMWLVQKVCSPAVWFLSHNTQLVLRLLRIPIHAPSPITDQEIRILMREGTETGQFEAGEQTIVMMALKLGDRRASTLMTPRTQMMVIDLADPPAEIRARLSSNQRARYPVVEGDLSHIVGVLEIRDLVSKGVSGTAEDIRALMKPPLFLPDTAPALKLFESFKYTGQQMAIIVDEYGDIEGIVTQNDLLESPGRRHRRGQWRARYCRRQTSRRFMDDRRHDATRRTVRPYWHQRPRLLGGRGGRSQYRRRLHHGQPQTNPPPGRPVPTGRRQIRSRQNARAPRRPGPRQRRTHRINFSKQCANIAQCPTP